MRSVLLMIIVTLLPASAAMAEQRGHPKPSKPVNSDRPLPLKGAARTSNSCAAYGAGFVKIEGTKTCMKIGGAVSIGVGGSSGGRY